MKRIIFFAAITMATASLFSCQNKASDTHKGDGPSLRTDSANDAIEIALLPTIDCLPFYAAEDMGLFDSLGVHVRLKTYQAAMDVDTAFCDSTADACVTDLVKLNHWISRGDSVCAILFADLRLDLVTSPQARIRDPQGLKEKIVAVTRNSALDFMADQVLTQARLGLDKLNRPQINDIALRTQMVNQNQYDGAFLPEPYATLAENQGARRIANLGQLKAQPMLALVVRTRTAQTERKRLQLIIQAYDEAVRRINQTRKKEPLKLLRLIPLACDMPDSLASIPAFGYATDSLPQTLEDSIESWLRRRGLLQRKPTVPTLTGTDTQQTHTRR